MPNDKICKLCGEPLPKLALHFSNRLAIEKGFCSWICLSMKIGHTKALALIKEGKEGQNQGKINRRGYRASEEDDSNG